MRGTKLMGAAVVAAVLLAGCGGDGDSGDEVDEGAGAVTDGGASDGGAPGGDASEGGAADAAAGDDPAAGGDGAAGADGGDAAATDGSQPVAPLTSQQICAGLPAEVVAAAIGVPSVAAQPSESETPQCAYVFEDGEGTPTNATVSVLRTAEDLGGREGAAAFAHVVDVNRRAAGDAQLTETVLDVGDQALLLSGGNLHFGVVQLGPRIVTTILRVGAGGAAEAAALTDATLALAP